MNIYTFNVETTWEVQAESEDEAWEYLPGAKETEEARISDQDVMLVEVVKVDEE